MLALHPKVEWLRRNWVAERDNLHNKVRKNMWSPKSRDARTLRIWSEDIQAQFPESSMAIEADVTGISVTLSSQSRKEKPLCPGESHHSTYRTDIYRMPMIAGVNWDAKIFLLSFEGLRSKQTKDVKWVLNKIFTSQPNIVCSDRSLSRLDQLQNICFVTGM